MMNRPTSIARLLSDAAVADADGIAVRDRSESLTWEHADRRAGRLAGALAEAGVVPGDRVGVHYRKSADSFLAMHAVVRCGGIAVPLDPTASGAYLSSVVDQTGCSVMLTHGACSRSARTVAATAALTTVIGLDDPGDEHRVGPTRWIGPDALDTFAERAPATIDPAAPAYIITTSGSTGRPKGICHTHASAAAHIGFMLDAYDIERDDRISDIAPNHFDISTLALWVAPSVGSTIVVVPEPHQMLPSSLAQLAADEGITVWYSVPYLLTQLNARANLDDHDLTALRWVLFGGEMFPPGALADLMSQWPHARFSNVFGPAEVNACLIHHVDEVPADDRPVAAGRPYGDTMIRLVDPDIGVDTPEGGAGEIWVAGSTMMTGYWERDDLTGAAVVHDASGRWYRTGDVGARRSDGEIVFLGRLDHQVKVRGYRVELEAVETALEDLAGIENAVAAVHRDADGQDVVIAGVVVTRDHPFDAQRMLAAVGGRLPTYAVPAALYALDDSVPRPLTGSGKLDRRTIRADVARIHQRALVRPQIEGDLS